MRVLVSLFFALLIATPVWSADNKTTTNHVFAAGSPSIVVLQAVNANGDVLSQETGVTFAKGAVVSNCHTFEKSDIGSASVFYGKKRFLATPRYTDLDYDLCLFRVEGLTAPPAQLGTKFKLKLGENIYAISATAGMKLTMSDGQIASLQQIPGPGGLVIRMTAPLSPDASGGGLFDSEGHLIGIISYYEKEGKQLNFALPVTWINSLSEHGITLRQLTNRTSNADDNFYKGMQAELAGDYVTALAVFRPLAEQGFAGAQFNLGLIYNNGWGISKNSSEAFDWYKKAAAQGDATAEYSVGVFYSFGFDGAQKDYTKAAYWFLKAADEGDVDAQREIGAAYVSGRGVPQDYIQAAKWLTLAAAGGDGISGMLLSLLERQTMTSSQITEAQRLAREWRVAHHVQ